MGEAMTTNQTIDGVPREQLVRWEEMLRTPPGRQELLGELRALLDAPAAPVTPCAIADALEASQWPNTSIGNKVLVAAAITELRKAAHPHGEPVAHTMKSIMYAICSIDGFPMLTSNQCHALAAKLNAEQPAPVVSVPEHLVMTDGLHTYEYVTGHNAAIDKMLGKV